MAEAVAEGLRAAGCKTTMFNTNEGRFNLLDFPQYDCVAFGTPDYYSYIAGGLKVFLDDWYIAGKTNRQGLEDKPYGLFYSHGGTGAASEPLERLFRYLGSQTGETVESHGAPNVTVLEECRQLGRILAEAAS